ncbi:hypothetical protein C8Q69DRAFT_507882 [Paecilomyces variotii]|uniref:Uncharacterized protein n=1 Tax=Byssochlamys spectabilis TaxID=264951 RepID=A0A443HRR8_BYSSP|nr:hypothetical protein C8Q69DRAFT_507882 [Paecilomyces variotii]KAJ9365518.1 hypothetical protein DTO280E4_487 [Paecilomyces variotii]RWQ94511.1 hypothetical protein C8Q69DRAFT_507882 [Paecilomyces variotii]
MPPSTVFSYWRREHRRPSSSLPTSPLPVPSANLSDNPPQLPGIPQTPILADAIIDSSAVSDTYSPVPLSEDPPGWTANKPMAGVASPDTQQSPVNLRVPSPTLERLSRPNSSPDETKKKPTITTQSNLSQQSVIPSRQEHSESESSKPNSPWRLTFGKGFLNPQSQSSDGHKRSSMHGGIVGEKLRLKSSPEDSPGEAGAQSRDFKADNFGSRRYSDNELPVEHAPQKHGKTKLHLLNPMSLLARRRSSQLAHAKPDELKIVPAIPDDYDPRIRGKIVHDFSAPRQRRNVSMVAASSQDTSQQSSGLSPYQTTDSNRRHSQHSPVFKEHFEDDQKALQIENKGYLQSSLLTGPPPSSHDPGAVPAFAKNLPSQLPEHTEEAAERPVEDSESSSGSHSPTKRASPNQQQGGNTESRATGLPRHLRSNASRFSFDMVGVGSSVQEKLLEEKHKEKEAARRAKADLERSEYSDDEDEFDYDLDDDIDGLEERIPGVNADSDPDEEEDEEFRGFSGPGKIVKNTFFVPSLPPVIASPVNPDGTGPDAVSQPHGEQAERANSVSDYGDAAGDERKQDPQNHETVDMSNPGEIVEVPGASKIENQQSADDFYFHDEEFDDLTADTGEERFDESIFDDETSHLYDRKVSAPALGAVPEAQIAPSEPLQDTSQTTDEEPIMNGNLRHVPSLASDFGSRPMQSSLPQRIPSMTSPTSHVGVLSEHNLEVFHNALAKAASDAALQRTSSVSEVSLGRESTTRSVESHPGLVSDDSRLSQTQTVDTMAFDDIFDDDGFNYDDDGFDDDPIIAEANAEALQNDDEGFYGREFGFYPQAYGNGASEMVNGGYFLPRGIEGVHRSHSGRVNFREPSLTPITERSEWSTRNSIISLTAHGAAHSNPSLSSPGLAQLVDMGGMDDEMSLNALMKLRRGAFGGSNGSLRSSASPSPQPQQPPSNRASFHSACVAFMDPANTLVDSPGAMNPISPLPFSDEEGSPTSPTLTSSFYQKLPKPVVAEGEVRSPTTNNRPRPSHSRNSSSASVSYIKETDEDGSSKWVLERRRPSDSGEMEVYQREVLEEGRI